MAALTDYFERINPITRITEKFAAVRRGDDELISQAVVVDIGGFACDEDHPIPIALDAATIAALTS